MDKNRVAIVVDDSMLVRHCVRRFLEQRGFSVHAASDGYEALEKLAQTHVDLVVTDVEMPRMDGLELITELKRAARTRKTPVIIVTGRKVPGDHEGWADYSIYKDIDIEGQLGKALTKIFGSAIAAKMGK